MTRKQQAWAEKHDWFLQALQGGVVVRDEIMHRSGQVTLKERTFFDFEELKSWAGY